jgi:predicted secreted Zn-dependent protease
MPRYPTYGEIAYRTFSGLDESLARPGDFEALTETMQTRWQNTAASVIAEFRKRQIDLSRQTQEQHTIPIETELERKYREDVERGLHPGPIGPVIPIEPIN